MNNSDFKRQQQAAVEKMREMNRQARSYNFLQNNPHSPQASAPIDNRQSTNTKQHPSNEKKSSVTQTVNEAKQQKNPLPDSGIPLLSGGGLNIPLLDNLKNDGDVALILGLLLILMSENCDKKLLFALIYILL